MNVFFKNLFTEKFQSNHGTRNLENWKFICKSIFTIWKCKKVKIQRGNKSTQNFIVKGYKPFVSFTMNVIYNKIFYS